MAICKTLFFPDDILPTCGIGSFFSQLGKMGSHSSHVSNISFVFFLLLLLLAVNYDLAAVVAALAFAVEKVILTCCCVNVIAVRVLVIKLTVIVDVYMLCVQCW